MKKYIFVVIYSIVLLSLISMVTSEVISMGFYFVVTVVVTGIYVIALEKLSPR